jgi:PAS domain S-box-containing protein
MVNLKIKLLILISGIIVIIVIGIAIVTINREEIFLHEQNDKLGLAIAHDAARYSVAAIISRDIYSLLTLVKLTMEQDYVTHVIILDPDGKVLAHNKLSEIGKIYTDSITKSDIHARSPQISAHYRTEKGELIADIIVPIEVGGVRVGTVRIGHSHLAIEKEIDTAIKQMLLLGLTSVFGGIIAAFILATYISKPIRKITSAMESVASGNLSVSVEFKSEDEIGQLSATFNKMAEDLRKTTVSRDFVDNIIESMADALIVATPEGTIIRVNQTTLNILGYIEDELLKKPMDMIFENALSKKPLLEEIIEKDFISKKEKDCLTKDGRKIPVLFSGSVMHNTDGDIEAIVCVVQDISKLKKAEVTLKRSYEELKITQDQLIQSSKLASIGELASGVAHELNQPLMVIRTGAQFTLRKLRKNPLNKDELVDNLTAVERNTKRMMNIINHLRAFSRQGKMELVPLDVNKVIQSCFLMIGEQLKLRNIVIKQNFSKGLPKVLGDTNQLEQVFLNLLSNAKDAVVSRAEVENTKDYTDFQGEIIIITRVSDRKEVQVLIKDNGSGIPLDKKNKIFDPFYTTKEVGKGTGLGLSISYGIIKDHKGEIDVAETGSEGTMFRIRLAAL